MKKNNIDFESIPNVPVSQITKDRILNNVLKSKNRQRKNRFKNALEVFSPITVASAAIILLLLLTTTYSIGPNSYYDGFYLMIEGVEGANIFLDEEQLGQIPLTDKIDKGGQLRITKYGYEDWVGYYDGKSLSSFLRTFHSPGKYQLYRGNNTVKIEVELKPMTNDTITFYTEAPGATVLVNGRYAGLTPTPITLSANYNLVEIIQPQKEKITLELLYDGNVRFREDVGIELEYTEKGYSMRLESKELYYPLRGSWLNEREYLVLEYNGSEYRGRKINIINGRVTVAGDEEIVGLLNLEKQKNDALNLLKDNANARVVRYEEEGIYYQDGEVLYYTNLNLGTRSTLVRNLHGEVGYAQSRLDGIYLTRDNKLYRYSSDSVYSIGENLNAVAHFTLNEDEILIFNLEQYFEIWHVNLEKESIRKIY